MKPKHTPEPWELLPNDRRSKRLTDTRYGEDRKFIGVIWHGTEEEETNAARIVACVNAMAGIEDPFAARAVLDDPKTAAATDLLAAAKRYEELFEEVSAEASWNRKKNRGATDWGKVNEILLQFRDSIARAEGRK